MKGEEEGEEGGGKTKISNDLRQFKKDELIDLAVKLGMSREDADVEKRWPLVQFIARNSYNERPDLYRDQKHNQQQLNQEFMERIQYLFNEQRDKLQKTEVEQPVSAGPGIAVNFQHTDLRQLRSLDHPDDMAHNVFIGGGYFQEAGDSDFLHNTQLVSQKPIGAQGGYRKTPMGYESSKGL